VCLTEDLVRTTRERLAAQRGRETPHTVILCKSNHQEPYTARADTNTAPWRPNPQLPPFALPYLDSGAGGYRTCRSRGCTARTSSSPSMMAGDPCWRTRRRRWTQQSRESPGDCWRWNPGAIGPLTTLLWGCRWYPACGFTRSNRWTRRAREQQRSSLSHSSRSINQFTSSSRGGRY
jgi:hypothetical protein